jgi:hypothetical protein
MEDLTLNFDYRGSELELPLRLYPYGYTYRIEIKAGDDLIIFEPDEEGNYRAITGNMTDKGLLSAIAVQLEKLR